jgi:uncharacterized protein
MTASQENFPGIALWDQDVSGSQGAEPEEGKKALERLFSILQHAGPLVVAFSGGVDSGLLAWASMKVLGQDHVLCVTARSNSLAPEELSACQKLAEQWGLSWSVIETLEETNPLYVANGADRCYWCKDALMDALLPLAHARKARVVLGVNLDDLGDYRPGQEAARSRGAWFPLVDAGLTKKLVRLAAKEAGLSIWEKPSAACLASRVPYGTRVEAPVLARVAAAERALKNIGFSELRVRHYGDVARVELPLEQLGRALELREEIVKGVQEAGYLYVTLDLEGLRSGNLNRALS